MANHHSRKEKDSGPLDRYSHGKYPEKTLTRRIAEAKVMLESGATHALVARTTGLASRTIVKVGKGEYDSQIPASMLDTLRAQESSKITQLAGFILDRTLADPGVIDEATLPQRADAFKKFVEVRELIDGRPTSRVDLLMHMADDDLEAELEKTAKEILKRTGKLPLELDVTDASRS